jgi:C4-dicarboxylate transporter DctM subunit
MNHEIVGAIGIVVMLLLMFIGIPLGICMALVGIVGFAIVAGMNTALGMVGGTAYFTIATYDFSALPVFMLLGEFADLSGMMRNSYRAANTWLGQLPGGLAMASIVGTALFSAVSGSSLACAACTTRVALPSLLEHKYHPRLATGALVAGGSLGNLVPPGTAFILYAILSETSVGKLYTASLIPGIVLTFMYVAQIYFQCWRNPLMGPPGPITTWKQKLFAFQDIWMVAVLFLVVMGGIYLGVFGATEAGSIAVVAAFLFAFFLRTVNRQSLTQTFNNTIKICGMAFAIIISAMIFGKFIVISGLSQALTDWVVGLNLPPIGVIIIIMLIYSFLGTAMDTGSMIFTTLPIFIPLVSSLGIDLIWFGVLVIIQMEFSNITPPVGMNLFVVAAMVKDKGISMGDVFMGSLPFCLTMLVFNCFIVAFPQISMFLVNAMK